MMDFSRFIEVKNSTSKMSPLEKLSALLPNLSFPSLESMLADFASAFDQGSRLVKLQIGDGSLFAGRLLPQKADGTEALSTLYKYEITCLSPDAFIPLESLLGLPAQLDIITGDYDPEEVTRCGIITAARSLPADGGFAKYLLTIEPPLALLRHRTTSRVFQDMTVPQIVEQVLDEHIAANSAVARTLNQEYDFVRRHLYTPRSYCLQYRETDLGFIERLLFEEGLPYRFGHEGGETPNVTFIVFDDPYSLPQNSQESVRFHRAEATEKEDSITQWVGARRAGVGRAQLASYDYKPVYTNEVGENTGAQGIAAESGLEDFDAQTLYYAKHYEDLQRYALRRQEAHDWAKGGHTAQGNLRQLQAGQWFALKGHPYFDRFNVQGEREFVACSLSFTAHNNFPDGLARRLDKQAETPSPYRVEIETRKRGLPLAPAYGHTRHAKPTSLGMQTATVTGPEGETEVYTDEMGRIKVQFHWQRQKEHPAFGANLDERSSCWLRVAYPGAGGAWGHQSIPRVGQEVLVDFIENDIDRPIVTGVIHNGRQSNPWFSDAGSLPANRALTGIKTQEHYGQQYGELLFDDTTNQVRTKLSSEHGKTQLNQGYLTHPRRDGDAIPRGEGFELRTDRHGAVRATEGLLITTESRPGASGSQMDRDSAASLLQSGHKNAQMLSDAAKGQDADVMEIGPETCDEEGSKGQKASSGHFEHIVETVGAWEASTNTDPEGDTATGEQPGRQPVIVLSGQEGIGLVTPKELVLTSGANLDTVSLRDTQQTSVRRWVANAGKKISLFVVGVKDKVNLKLIAAKGDVQMQAQAGDIEITGDKNVKLTGNKEKVVMAGKEEAIFMCAGAYIRLSGGNIDIHCPGNLTVKSAGHSFTGPTSMNVDMPKMPAPGELESLGPYVGHYQLFKTDNRPFEGYRYKIVDAGGEVLKEGLTDTDGYAEIVSTEVGMPVYAYQALMRESERITEDFASKVEAAASAALKEN